MNTVFRHSLTLTIGLLIGICVTVGPRVWADRAEINQLPLDEIRTFTDVLDRIRRDYVESIDEKTLLENAIRGMLSGLDPHSAYLDNEAFHELQTGTSGEFGGLGIEVGMEDGFVKVISPIDDTPAYRAGVKTGDLIIRLDETPVKGMTLNEAVKLMRGKPGEEIILTIVREGEEKPLKIAVERDVIHIRSVRSRILEPGFGYARVTQFQSRTAQFLRDAIDKLQTENDSPLRGLILDLRNNPGGVLTGAVEISDIFLEEGLVVYTEGRTGGSQQRFSATPGDALNGAPLIVLVNGGSASASEIVAGALQDHRRGLIVGEPTFGKGSVQTILPLSNGTAVKLTTARYFTPDGRSIQAEGIQPDIKLERLQLAADNKSGIQPIKEANLSGHLANPDEEGAEGNNQTESKKQPKQSLAKTDYQLYEALNLLKGLVLLSKRDE